MSTDNKKQVLAKRIEDAVNAVYSTGFQDGIKHVSGLNSKSINPAKLLGRFVSVYGKAPLTGSMIPDGMKLWRDYYEWSGEHMILTDEGWEPGLAKQSYIDSLDIDELIESIIHDEVNAPPEVSDEQ